MTRLRTSANELYGWLGVAALRRSDNLRLPDPRKAADARRIWEKLILGSDTDDDTDDGGDDHAA